jgi:hypothetical protein
MSTHLNRITRTTADLIAELEGESENFDAVGIAVGFEQNAMFIFADDTDRIEKLNAALGQGGQAIGLIGIRQLGKRFAVLSRVFREYKGEQWAKEFLDELSDSCGQKLKHVLGTKPISELLN